MKPIHILLILVITIFAGCNKNKTDADLLYTDTVWAYVSDNPFYVMENTTLSLQKNTTQSHKLRNDQGKTMIAKDSFVPLL